MRFLRLAKKNGTLNELYEQEVIRLIRKKYTINQELAILRQRDTKPTEFEEYNTYVEECKRVVKDEIDKVEADE